MLKKDLEKALEEQRQYIANLHQTIDELKTQISQQQKQHEQRLQQCRRDVFTQAYSRWKSVNASFMSEFIKEELSNKLTIELRTDYGGDIEVQVHYNKQLISSASDSVIMHRNSLDE